MQQYRELVSNITTRHLQWYRYVQTASNWIWPSMGDHQSRG